MVHEQILQLDKNERILYTAKRSFFGIIPHVLFATVLFLVFLGAVFYIARFQDQLKFPVPVALLVSTGVLVVGEIATYLMIRTYFRTTFIITNESIIEHQQVTPFASKSSQLSLANIEDVSLRQSGFFANIFNFGNVDVQTAGEKPNFILTFAHNPREVTSIIIEAQEKLLEQNKSYVTD